MICIVSYEMIRLAVVAVSDWRRNVTEIWNTVLIRLFLFLFLIIIIT